MYSNGQLPRLPMPGMPPKPPRPNGDWAGSGGGAPVFPLFRKRVTSWMLRVWCGDHLVGGAGAGVGEGAAGAAAAAPPCLITRWTVIPSWYQDIVKHALAVVHLNIVGGKCFLVFHYFAGKDEAEVFNRSPRKFRRNCFLELGNTEWMKEQKCTDIWVMGVMAHTHNVDMT